MAQSKIGYAPFQATTDATYACFSQKSGTFAIPQVYNSYGGLNQNVLQNLKLAKNRGFETDIYMFSCPGKDPYQQVEEMTNGVPSDLYNTVWLRVSNNKSPGCSWYSNPPQKNCQFLRSLVNGVQAKGKNVGILSTIYDWNATFKNVSSCPQVASVPLMYGSNDGVASLSGFVAFGGWKDSYSQGVHLQCFCVQPDRIFDFQTLISAYSYIVRSNENNICKTFKNMKNHD